MSFLHSNDDKASFMNNRIPRKKTASSTLIDSGSKTAAGIQSSTCTAKQPAATADILALPIPRKSKDGAPSNDKKKDT